MAELVYDVDSFVAECIKYRSKIEVSILTLAEIAATKMEAYAKENAPWTDRTGNARQKLAGSAGFITQDQVMIVVAHHMSYGYWLELAHQRRFKILEESIEENVEELYRSLRRLLS